MTATLSQRLKQAGAELHDRAETAGFTRELFKGRRPIDDYAALLAQMLHVHEALERALDAVDHPTARTLLADDTPKSPLIREDLAALGVDPDEPLPATRAFINEIERADPAWLLGVHYVLEGSTNGNRFVAAALRKAYELEGDRATRYLDPYADTQRARWAAFKQTLDALDLTEAEQETMIEADLATFRAIIDIHEALDRATIAA